MKNDFYKGVFELFDKGGYCDSWETGMSNADCIHHVLGRCSNSPYNAAPLNNFNDHMPEGRKNLPPLSSQAVKSKYLQKTKSHLDEIGYLPTEKDLEFLYLHKKYYETTT